MAPKRPELTIPLLQALDESSDYDPLTPEQQAQMPSKEELDAGLKRTLAFMKAARAARRLQSPETLRTSREADRAKLKANTVRRSRQENLSLIASLMARLPAGTPVHAFHRDYEHDSDSSLDQIVAELEYLTAPK